MREQNIRAPNSSCKRPWNAVAVAEIRQMASSSSAEINSKDGEICLTLIGTFPQHAGMFPRVTVAPKRKGQYSLLLSFFFFFKKRYPKQGIIPVLCVRLQTQKSHIHKQPEPEQLPMELLIFLISRIEPATSSAAIGRTITKPTVSSNYLTSNLLIKSL